MIKLHLFLLLLVLSVVHCSPLYERNRKGVTRKKANEEVRSIISAIVDAILDGDRKRRSEVVDFDDENPHDGNKNTASLKNLKDNEAQSGKIFTKREERESDDNSVPLADVIATSVVNSTDDETEIVKKDVIQYTSNKKTAKNDASNSNEQAFEKSSDKSDKKDNPSASGFQNNFLKSKSEENPGIANSFYEVPDKDEPSVDQNKAKQYQQEFIVTKSSSNGQEDEVKKSQMQPELNASTQKPSSGNSINFSDVGKENSKINNVGKTNSPPILTQNISSQSKTKKNANKNYKQFQADTYAQFLQITKPPQSLQKHSTVEHADDDDSEMNENPEKSLSSRKPNKFQESKNSMDEDDTETDDDDRMEDSKENDSKKLSDHSENEDKFMENDQDKTSSDAKEMGEEDDSKENKQTKGQSEQTDKPANHADMDSDEDMMSEKSSSKQSGMKAQSKMKTKEDDEDNSEMDGSAENERINDGSGSKDSGDKSMRSEEDSSEESDTVSENDKTSDHGDKTKSTAGNDSSSVDANEEGDENDTESTTDNSDSVSGKASETGDKTESTADNDSVSEKHKTGELGNNIKKTTDTSDSEFVKANEHGDKSEADSNSGQSKTSEAGDKTRSEANTDSDFRQTDKPGSTTDSESVSGKASKPRDENNTGSTLDTKLVLDDNKAKEAGDKTKSVTNNESASSKASDSENTTELTTNADSASEDSEAEDEIESTNDEGSSVVQIGDETNVNGLDTGSADIDSISGDGSGIKITDNVNDIGNSPGKEPDPSLENNLKTYEDSSKTDSDGSDDLRETEKNENMDSVMENATPLNDNTEDEKVNIKHTKSKQDTMESKTGQISASINGQENDGMEEVKNSANKEVKLGESGKILETSYRFNDDDTPEVDDYADQANEVWTSKSHDPLLTGDDTPDLVRNEETTQSIQPDDAKYGNNVHIGNGFEDSYSKQNWEDERMQTPIQSNDYNWLTTGLKNTQHLPNIQDQMPAYQTPDWNDKAYLDQGSSYQTTEQPELEKRTTIPSTQMAQYTQDDKKLSRTTPRMIENKHYTVAADTLTDNDVYGYAGSIGPFLQKRAFVSREVDPRPEQTKKDDILESLVTDVKEPWIKHFLTKTLEMAVKGDKGVLTSKQDGRDDVEDKPPSSRDELDKAVPKLSQETKIKEDDDMPLDATNNKDDSDDVENSENTTSKNEDSSDDDEDSNDEQDKQTEKTASTRENSEEQKDQPATHEDIPNIAPKLEETPLSEVLTHIPKHESPQSPVADIGTISSQDDQPLKSVIRITTRIPVTKPAQAPLTEQTPVDQHVPDQSESLPSVSTQVPADHHIPEQSDVPPVQAPTSQMIPSTSQQSSSSLPQQPYIPSSYMVPETFPEWSSFPEYKPSPQLSPPESQTTKPSPPIATSQDLTSSNQAARAVLGPIIKVVTTPGTNVTFKLTSKGQLDNANEKTMKFQSEIHDALNNSIQNIGISSSNNVLENTIKEAELIHVLKDAIPFNQRRPVGTEDDLKQGLDDLKDYAVALTDATGLSQAQRDNVAEKLARNLLDEMRVTDGRKDQLLKELMSFVTAMEVSTFKERLNEIKSRIIQLSTENPQDFVKTRLTAIKLLDELFKQLPLPKEQIKETERNIGDSKLLKSLLQEGEKRVLRSKLKKALLDLVADKLL